MPKAPMTSPADRPMRLLSVRELAARFATALANADGITGAHCIHERWMRGEMSVHIEAALAALWQHAADTIPLWLPTQYVEWLPLVYETTALYSPPRGRSNIYLVLLDYADRPAHRQGIYVGMTAHDPALRFEQHKAGIRAAGSVLKRGLELLAGPTLHLQRIRRADAVQIEEQLAEALRARGLLVQGGH
jgi:predicted GIY-YIG superfamily endonuclease